MADDFNILVVKRKEKGYTQAHVAADLELSVSMICKLEKGTVSFTKDVVDKLNSYYEINLIPQKYKCELVENEDKQWFIRENEELKLKNKELKEEKRALVEENRKLKAKLLSLKASLSGDFAAILDSAI